MKVEGEIQLTDTCWTGSTGRQEAHTSQPDMSDSDTHREADKLSHTHTHTISHTEQTVYYAHQVHHTYVRHTQYN